MGHLGAWAPGWNTNSFRYVDIYIYLGYVYLRYVGGTYDLDMHIMGYAYLIMCTYLSYLYIYLICTRTIEHTYPRYI